MTSTQPNAIQNPFMEADHRHQSLISDGGLQMHCLSRL